MSKFLCSQSQMIFIGGNGSTATTSKKQSTLLSGKMAYNPSRVHVFAAEYIVNDATLTNTNSKLIDCIQIAAKSVKACSKKNGISLIFFVHSLGAKVIYQALEKEKIDLGERSHIAVFSFGGVQKPAGSSRIRFIPQDFAGIVTNFLFENDKMAWIGTWTIGGGVLEDNVFLLRPSSLAEDNYKRAVDEVEATFSELIVASGKSITNSDGIESAKFANAAKTLATNSIEMITSYHYMDEYLDSDAAFNEIWKVLGINENGITTSCNCTKTYFRFEEIWRNEDRRCTE